MSLALGSNTTTNDLVKIAKQRKSARDTVSSVTGFIEFLTDHFNDSLGNIFIKASPILAPIPSGIAIAIAMFAYFYLIIGEWYTSVALSIVVAFVVEGLGFAAVDAKNRIEAHNRGIANESEHLDYSKAQRAINTYFAVTIGAIFMFETVPGWVAWYNALGVHGGNEPVTIVDALRGTAPLVFPFFANIGASIYSLMDVLKGIQGDKKSEEEAYRNSLLDNIKMLKDELAQKVNLHQSEIDGMKRSFSATLDDARVSTAERVAGDYKVIIAGLERDVTYLNKQLEAVAINGEMVKKMAEDSAKQEAEKAYHDRIVELETELRFAREKNGELAQNVERLTSQLTRQNRQQVVVAKPSRNRQSDLSETEIEYCNRIVDLVEENDIKTWKDMEALTEWSQKTCERYGKLAKDNGYVEKVDGLYRRA